MAQSPVPAADFARLWKEMGPRKLAERLGITERTVFEHRKRVERELGIELLGPNGTAPNRVETAHHAPRLELEVKNGVVLVGSDAHFWPGPISTAWRAFVGAHKELKPKATILNGDVLDMAAVSRHPPIGWESHPTVQEEIEFAQERLGEIESQKSKGERLIWTLGNHDQRFETRLASLAPEYAKVAGIHLHDHFPVWDRCWSVWINNDVAVKHRFKGGIHATHNNALWSGKTIVTGHLHSAKVTPLTDYNGTKYGVDTGCLADTSHAAFNYMEDNPRNWRSGFAVLTFVNGQLLMPELLSVWDESHVQFRGELVRV